MKRDDAGIAALLVVGVLAISVSAVSDVVHLLSGTSGTHVNPAWLLVVVVPTFVIGARAQRRRPAHPAARQLLAFGSLMAISELVGTIETWTSTGPVATTSAGVALAHHLVVAVTVAVVIRLIALYPEGSTEHPGLGRALSATWAIVLLPPIVAISHPTVVLPAFSADPTGDANPWFVEQLAPLGELAYPLLLGTQALVLPAIVVLATRYRRGGADRRRRIRWLLLPAVAVAVVLVLDMLSLLAPATEARGLVSALWLPILPLWTAAMAAGLGTHHRLTVDLVLRRSLVYGALWTLIGVAYVALAAALGMVAIDHLPVEAAIVTTIVATLVFQPLRRWLEQLADQWVFGERLGRYESLRRLGQTLETGPDLHELLPSLAATIRDGLGLAAVRVVVGTSEDEATTPEELEGRSGSAEDGHPPDVVVPITEGDDRLGRIECFTAGHGLDDADRELLRELARQSGLALRNLRLTRDLERTVTSLRRRTEELQRSRAEIVRAQEDERRRLERDLHDGVQQHIVATIAQIGLARRHTERAPASAPAELAALHRELTLILDELRELARGVHPSLLSAGGLVAAVEAQTSRSPLPVTVRADPEVRHQRYPPELEGAAYFTVTESLTNVLKHASATCAEVRLERHNGSLHIAVQDDGCGFDTHSAPGLGLRNLTGRVEALGGRLVVDSRIGQGTTITAELALDTEEARRG